MTYNSWVSTFMINEWSISIIISSKLMIQTTRWCPRLRHRKVGENNQYVTWMYGNYNHGIVYWFMALITRVVVLVRRDTSIYPYIPSISQSDWWVYKPTNTTGGIWGVGHHQTYQSSKSRSHSWCRFGIFFCAVGLSAVSMVRAEYFIHGEHTRNYHSKQHLAIILHFTAKIKWSLSFSVCFWGLGDFEPCFFSTMTAWKWVKTQILYIL